MGDINDWAKMIRGRWDWHRGGYERGFPRNCGFTDIDAVVEFDGRQLIVEPKHHDGIGPMGMPPDGQLMFLRGEVRLGKAVIVLYGCGPCNSPWGVRVLGAGKADDRWEDWRDIYDVEERRKLLKHEFDLAMGLA